MKLCPLHLAFWFLLTSGCAHSNSAGPVRFVNQAPVAVVNDRRPLVEKPSAEQKSPLLYVFDAIWVDALSGSLKLRSKLRASNVNSIDEVPDSTWFRNRIGKRDLSLEEVQLGPKPADAPGASLPWTIVSSKVGGGNAGFVIRDARGDKYLLKFDFADAPEMDTGAHVIVQRILWACGYNVPQDEIVYFEREQLILSPDAVVKDVFGNKRAMAPRFVEQQLRRIEAKAGMPLRGLLSRYVDGIPVGGFSQSGIREDDPNDTVPHEHRRELRGLQPIAAWLGHTDIKDANTLDAWTADTENEDHHYLVHYLIDFGNALGTMAERERWQAYSFSHILDWPWLARSVASLGLWPRPWDGLKSTPPRQIGLFESHHYEPGSFRTNLPYRPFEEMDRFDGFWGAKLLMRFSRDQLEAIVSQAKYSDSEANQYVVDTLVARQRKTARYWFRKVAPLDRFRVTQAGSEGFSLCFDDLMLSYALESAQASVAYWVRSYDYKGKLLAPLRTLRGTKSVCVRALEQAASQDGYTIVRMDRSANHHAPQTVLVHVALDNNKKLRVIGLWRD